jgi:hypothetical protein
MHARDRSSQISGRTGRAAVASGCRGRETATQLGGRSCETATQLGRSHSPCAVGGPESMTGFFRHRQIDPKSLRRKELPALARHFLATLPGIRPKWRRIRAFLRHAETHKPRARRDLRRHASAQGSRILRHPCRRAGEIILARQTHRLRGAKVLFQLARSHWSFGFRHSDFLRRLSFATGHLLSATSATVTVFITSP